MAYQTFRQTFGDSHVGTVRLTANVRELDEMGVTARRPYVRAEGGKLVYDVKSLLNPNRSLETELALFLMTAIRKM